MNTKEKNIKVENSLKKIFVKYNVTFIFDIYFEYATDNSSFINGFENCYTL